MKEDEGLVKYGIKDFVELDAGLIACHSRSKEAAMEDQNLWRGLKANARERLLTRYYNSPAIEERLGGEGLEAATAVAGERALKQAKVWIPGVEIIPKIVHPQRHRGFFSELGREGEGRLGQLGLWPRQWASARMFAGSAKGFHVHPPFIPPDEMPASWFEKLFCGEENAISLRPYDREQWDIMFFLQGRLDLILSDEREGLPRRRMRIFIDGDDRRGGNNVAVVIPPGVAHALRVEGSEDLFMVYGTTTTFTPEFEGRIASSVEESALPPEWQEFLS